MNKLTFGILFLVLSGAAALGIKFFQNENQQNLTQETSDNQQYDMTINIYKDSFEGYRIMCSNYMKNQLRTSKYKLNCVDDGANYQERMEALKSGKAQFAMLEVGSYIIEGKDYGYPATLISVIDRSYGADAIVAKKSIFDNIDDLKGSSAKVALTPKSPSEVFSNIVEQHFDLNFFKSSNIVESTNSSDALKKLKSGQVDVAVVWEPEVSELVSTGEYVVLMSTKQAQDTIIDALGVNRKFAADNPNVVKIVLSSYFKTLKFFKDNPQELIKEIQSDSSLNEKQIETLVQGIDWVNLNNNCKVWFACDPQDWAARQKIVDTLQSLSKMFINNNVFNSSPFPKNDVYTLVNSEFIFDLYKNGIGVFDNNTEQNSLERDFTNLTLEQWNSLKEFGQLKQRPILFAKNNELRITSQEAISEIVRDIEHYPNYRIKIEGHTGTLGDPIKNKILSETRAEWVKKYMVQTYNIDPDRILIIGYGGEKPLAPSIEENEFSKSYQAKLARVSVILLQEEL